MAAIGFIPYQESRQHRGPGSERERGDSRGGCGRYAEEIDECAFAPRRVLIDEDTDRFIIAERSEQITSGVLATDRSIASQPSIPRDQSIHSRIVDLAHDKLHRMAVYGVRKRAQFPGAAMRRQKDHASSAPDAFSIVVESFIRD